MRRWLPAALMALLLAGCAGPGVRGDASCVTLARGAGTCLLPPAALPEMELRHLVQLERDGRRENFIGQLRVDADALHLAAVSPFGAHLFTVRWDGAAATVTPARGAVRPELLVALLQLALADPDTLRPALRGLTLQVDVQGGVETRELRRGREVLARIVRRGDLSADGSLELAFPRADLELRLLPLGGSR